MSRRGRQMLIAAALDLVVLTVWIYGVLNRDPQLAVSLTVAAFVAVAAAQVAAGRVIGWWSLLLVLAAPLLALPAGAAEPDADFSIAVLMIIWSPVFVLLLVAGACWRDRPRRGSKPMPPKTDAEKARELERTIQAGIAMHKPPTGPGG